MMVGDFNDIASNEEKWGGRLRPEENFQDFNNLLNNINAIDIGNEGRFWTWMPHWEGKEITERLDRVVVSINWHQAFTRAKRMHIEKKASNHSLLLIHTTPD